MLRNLMLGIIVLGFSSALIAQQPLNNDSVIKMAKAGLADDIIVSTINASPGTYDASADGLIALKQAGVSDKVVAAIVTKGTVPVAATSGSQAQAVQAPQTAPPPPFRSTDGKVRIYVTDHPIFESNGISRAGGGGRASGNASGNASGFTAHSEASEGWGAASVSHTQAGDDPRTVEIEADIQKACPANVIASNNPDRSDYVLVFRRRGGERSSFFAFGGLSGLALSAMAKVDGASLFKNDGDMIYATKENTVEKSIKDVCTHLPPSAD